MWEYEAGALTKFPSLSIWVNGKLSFLFEPQTQRKKPLVNFINILHAAFFPTAFRQKKIQTQTISVLKSNAHDTFVQKGAHKMLVKLTSGVNPTKLRFLIYCCKA